MDKVTCKACDAEFDNEASLHRHLRKHNLLVEGYYQKYFPRYDKSSGEIIHFRNKAQYFSTDFNSRENLRKWLETTETATARAYCRLLLERRKDKKGLIWTPSQVELRTVMMPPIQFYDKLFGNYYELCKEIGFRNRFDCAARSMDISNKPDVLHIIVDNREQIPFEFPHAHAEPGTLKFADYYCTNGGSPSIYIERKTTNDLIGTLSSGMERFCRELDRSIEAKAIIVVLVEETLDNCMRFKHKKTAITPEYVLRNVRDLIQKYQNLQFLFVKNREEAAAITEKIFRSNISQTPIDLQAAYDIKNI